MAFIAVVRRVGGQFFKMPRCNDMGAIPLETRVINLGTYFTQWPRSLSTFLLYGSTRSSTHVAAADPAASGELNGYLSTNRKKFTLRNLATKHRNGVPLVMITTYDAPIAAIAHRAGVDMLLVGDSIGNTKLGYESTVPVNMEELLVAAAASRRGAKNAFIIGDLPFGSYLTVEDALRNSSALLKVGCDAVKLEGGERVAPLIEQITKCGIPVMAHIGLTPQSYTQQGGYGTQGKSVAAAEQVIADAKAVERAGAFSCVLEKIPSELATIITSEIGIPTIGIGAGPTTSGQVLVSDDLLGLSTQPPKNGKIQCPSFVKQYAGLSSIITEAFSTYAYEVRTRSFPERIHTSKMPELELAVLSQHYPDSGNVLQKKNDGDHGEKDQKLRLLPAGAAAVGAAMLGAKATRCDSPISNSTWCEDSKVPVVHTIAEMRAWAREQKASGRTVACVPTMGKLHRGHVSLVKAAADHCDVVVVSIFVNPSQFAASEDFDRFPSNFTDDLKALEFCAEKVCVFAPNAREMYPNDPRALELTTTVVPNGVRGQSEDAVRPTFFPGVATVCAMLFHIVEPEDVFFGQKDAMQCTVVRNMIRDLHFPLRFHVVPTARELNGLAMSSRNAYLSASQQDHAGCIFRSLKKGYQVSQEGESVRSVKDIVQKELVQGGYEVDYVSIAEPERMTECSEDCRDLVAGTVMSVAVRVKDANNKDVRLLDNIVF